MRGACRAARAANRARDGPFHVGVLLDNVPEFVFLLLRRRARRVRPSSGSIRRAAAPSSPATSATPTASWSSPTPRIGRCSTASTSGSAPTASSTSSPSAWRGWSRPRHAGTPRSRAALPGPETLFVLIFTSGSTGAPKAVRVRRAGSRGLGERMPFGPTTCCTARCRCSTATRSTRTSSRAAPPARRSRCGAGSPRRSSSPTFARYRRDVLQHRRAARSSYILSTPASPDDREHSRQVRARPESSPADVQRVPQALRHPADRGLRLERGRDHPHSRPGAAKPARSAGPSAGTDVVVVDPVTGRRMPARGARRARPAR